MNCRFYCGMACQCDLPGSEDTIPTDCVRYRFLMRYWHSEDAARADYLLRLREEDPEDEWIGGDEDVEDGEV